MSSFDAPSSTDADEGLQYSSGVQAFTQATYRASQMHVIRGDCLLTHPIERLLNACHLKRLSTHASYGEVTECMSSEAIVYSRIL